MVYGKRQNVHRRINLAVICCEFLVALFFCVSGSLLHAAESGATLENISFERESTNREKVMFQLNGPYIPKTFSTKGDTPKVVFDFLGTRHSAAVKGVMNSGGNLIKEIRVGMHTEPQLKTRVVFDLVSGEDYEFSQDFIQEKNILVISVFRTGKQGEKKAVALSEPKKEPQKDSNATSASSSGKKPAVTPAPEENIKASRKEGAQLEKKSASPGVSLLNSVTYEKNVEKGERVLFQVENFRPPVIFGIEEGVPGIVCDFLEATKAHGIAEVIPVQGEYVQKIRVEQNAKLHKVRVVLELVPNHHYDLQQIYFKEDHLYILYLKSQKSSGASENGSK